MKRLNFFALRNDLLAVLSKMESDRPLKYTREGMLSGSSPEIWEHGSELPHLGAATGDQHIACQPFLIVAKDAIVNVETRQIRNGGLRCYVEQRSNEDSVILIPGGEWKDGAVISGSITTASASSFSQALMRSAQSAFRRHFTMVQAFWVGPEALVALRKGRRLTYAIQSPPEYDLREMRD